MPRQYTRTRSGTKPKKTAGQSSVRTRKVPKTRPILAPPRGFKFRAFISGKARIEKWDPRIAIRLEKLTGKFPAEFGSKADAILHIDEKIRKIKHAGRKEALRKLKKDILRTMKA